MAVNPQNGAPKIGGLELLTTAQVAAIFGCSIATVNRMATDGRLPAAHKLPGARGAYLFTRAEVDQYLAAEQQDRKAS